MKSVVEIVLVALGLINLLLARFALLRLHQPTTLLAWIVKVFVSGLSPILFLAGLLIALLGVIINAVIPIVIGGLAALLYLVHINKITRAPNVRGASDQFFELVNRTIYETNGRFLSKRYVFLLPRKSSIVDSDVPFWTIQGSGRELLCDIWQPTTDVNHSGIAFIYLHGSAWTSLDKDFGTRILFQHLTSQGHVIMDVAYRLFPETDFMGMVHDVKHAIAWMKTNAAKYNVDAKRIVVGGGSAGAHLALLAAYTDKNEVFTPSGLENTDLSVHGVVSLYGQSDLVATYYHTCQHLTTRSAIPNKKAGSTGGMPSWIKKGMSKDFHRLGFDKDVEPGMLAPMLGGNPGDKPESYSLFSPIKHVHKDCPVTMLIHGEHDILAPLKAIRHLYTKLTEAGVPTAIHVIQQTDHAFDLILPRISPASHNAIYDVERFLALLALDSKFKERGEQIYEHP